MTLQFNIVSAQELNVNRIRMQFSNTGGLNKSGWYSSSWIGWNDPVWQNYLIFDQGLWVTGKRNGALGCVPYLWSSSFSPGPIMNEQPALKVKPQDSARYKVYTITAGESPEANLDLKNWPSDLGAPLDISGNPLILGDQTAWTLFNGADTSLYKYFFLNKKPFPRAVLPIEVRETVFEHFGEFTDTSIWANSLFFEWAIYNKGTDPLDSVYLTFWTDVDFIDPGKNFPAIDTSAQTGYCWYGTDSSFASAGYTLLFGPSIQSSGDTAIFFGKKRVGYKNLPLSSFWGILDDSYPDSSDFGPPYSRGTAWNVVRGLTQKGNPIIDSVTKKPTKFPYSGDPITRQGSQWPFPYTGGGAGFMITMGPLTIMPGDSQWMMIVLHPSEKLNGMDAINRMRANAQYLRSLPYDSLISRKPRRNVAIKQLPDFTIPSTFKLYSNYPNPFNGETIIPFDLPERSTVSIEIFDIIGRSIASLPDQVLDKGTQNVRWFPIASAGVYLLRVNVSSTESSAKWSGINKVVLLR